MWQAEYAMRRRKALIEKRDTLYHGPLRVIMHGGGADLSQTVQDAKLPPSDGLFVA